MMSSVAGPNRRGINHRLEQEVMLKARTASGFGDTFYFLSVPSIHLYFSFRLRVN